MNAETLTSRVLKDLVGEYGYKNIRPLQDKVGVFGHILRAPDGSRVFLVVKASRVSGGIVSCQAFMPRQAEAEEGVIMMAHAPEGDDLRYYLFRPKEVIVEAEGFNERLGVNFINFRIGLGLRFYPERQSIKVELKPKNGDVSLLQF
jgi:hypothetical protein